MKLSELILSLTGHLSQRGDIEVAIFDDSDTGGVQSSRVEVEYNDDLPDNPIVFVVVNSWRNP